jgi:hypothetical protein
MAKAAGRGKTGFSDARHWRRVIKSDRMSQRGEGGGGVKWLGSFARARWIIAHALMSISRLPRTLMGHGNGKLRYYANGFPRFTATEDRRGWGFARLHRMTNRQWSRTACAIFLDGRGRGRGGPIDRPLLTRVADKRTRFVCSDVEIAHASSTNLHRTRYKSRPARGSSDLWAIMRGIKWKN